MSSIQDRFEVTTHPAVITPFEDVDDPLIDADIPHDYYMFGPPSQSSDGRYTINSRSSAGRGRRLSNRTQLTEPSSISDMPSDCFPLAQHKKAMPRTGSPAISPTKSASPHRDITAYRSSVPDDKVKTHRRSHHHRPSAPRRHHTSCVDTPTRFHPEPMPQYSSPTHHHHPHLTPSSPSSHSRSQSRAPLILLHVTLLPSSSSASLPYPPHIMQRVLPRPTMRAFALLEERLADPVLMTRGLLVAHPRDEMDVLEERVLEGLELRPPRVLKCGHFYGAGGADDDTPSSTAAAAAANDDDDDDDTPSTAAHDKSIHHHNSRRDSGVEATTTHDAPPTEDEDDAEEEEEEADEITCTTCHAHLPLPNAPETTRWTIKTYAANGLLAGPGAWAAAWSEMERIDVSIAPHLTAAQHRALARAVREEEEEEEENARAAAAAAAAADADAAKREEKEKAEEAEREAAMEAEQQQQQQQREAEMKAEREALVQKAREEERERAQRQAAEAEQQAETQRLRLIGNAALAAAAERRAAEERVERERKEAVRAERRRARDERVRRAEAAEKARRELPLRVLLARAAWVVLADWRNAVIALLVAVVAWGVVAGAGVGAGRVDLDSPRLVAFDFDSIDRVVVVDNVTVPPLEVVVQTSTATATATHTSTAIVTAFVLETLSPVTTTTVLAEQPSILPSSSSSSSPDDVDDDDDADAAFKDAVFAASSDVLASAFEKMRAIVSTLTVAYEEGKEEEEEEEEEEAVSSVVVVADDDDDDNAAAFQKDAVFAASSDVLASAFEKMQAIVSALADAYEEGKEGEGEAVLPVAGLVDVVDAVDDNHVVVPEAAMVEDVCKPFGLAYPTCVTGEEAAVDDGIVDPVVEEEAPDVAATAVPGTSLSLGFAYFDPAAVCLAV